MIFNRSARAPIIIADMSVPVCLVTMVKESLISSGQLNRIAVSSRRRGLDPERTAVTLRLATRLEGKHRVRIAGAYSGHIDRGIPQDEQDDEGLFSRHCQRM